MPVSSAGTGIEAFCLDPRLGLEFGSNHERREGDRIFRSISSLITMVRSDISDFVTLRFMAGRRRYCAHRTVILWCPFDARRVFART